jgi:hypothetical protein
MTSFSIGLLIYVGGTNPASEVVRTGGNGKPNLKWARTLSEDGFRQGVTFTRSREG